MSKVEGYIDRLLGSRTVAGWARIDGQPLPKVRLLVFEGEVVIGRGNADLLREDLGSSCGFEVKCSKSILLDDIMAGRVWAAGFGESAPYILQPWREVSEEVTKEVIGTPQVGLRTSQTSTVVSPPNHASVPSVQGKTIASATVSSPNQASAPSVQDNTNYPADKGAGWYTHRPLR